MWRFTNEREAFWNQVIRGKYREDRGGWLTREVREGHGVGLWKAIRNLGHHVSSRFSFMVGNGQRVSFWKGKWCRNSPLCDSFPSLHALAAAKEAWVSDLWVISASGDLGGSWNPQFTKRFNDWELDELQDLLGCLCMERVMLDEEDRVRLSMSNHGNFSVKSLYKVLELNSSVCFPVKIIWNPWVQQKISFFAWEASWGKDLTLDQIQKKGWALANKCFLCQDYEESIDHLLLHCEKMREVWNLFFTLLGVC